MARVRYLEREDLAPEHQHLYDEIAASRGGLPPTRGPGGRAATRGALDALAVRNGSVDVV